MFPGCTGGVELCFVVLGRRFLYLGSRKCPHTLHTSTLEPFFSLWQKQTCYNRQVLDSCIFVMSVFSSTFLCVCLNVPASPKDETPVSGLKDQQVLGVWGHCQLFQHSVETLRSQLQEKGEGSELVWDKVTHQNKKGKKNTWRECSTVSVNTA